MSKCIKCGNFYFSEPDTDDELCFRCEMEEKDQQIAELQKQLEESEKLNKRLYNEKESAEKILRMSSNEQTREILELQKQLEASETQNKRVLGKLELITKSNQDLENQLEEKEKSLEYFKDRDEKASKEIKSKKF